MKPRTRCYTAAASILLTLTAPPHRVTGAAESRDQSAAAQASNQPQGQTATELPDGRWLFVGGVGSERTAIVWNPATGRATVPDAAPVVARAFHSATTLADGTVLLIGGQQGNAVAELAELFDPATNQFTVLPVAGTTARAFHTATLLTDGTVLVAGGTNGSSQPLPTEIWNVAQQAAASDTGAALDRRGHSAVLMPDGRVLVAGGTRIGGQRSAGGEIVDTVNGAVRPAPREDDHQPTIVSGSRPSDGASDVRWPTLLRCAFPNR